MKPNCTVTIHRQNERPQVFDGIIVGESTTHFLVKHDGKDSTGEGAEWFAKNSKAVTSFKWKDQLLIYNPSVGTNPANTALSSKRFLVALEDTTKV